MQRYVFNLGSKKHKRGRKMEQEKPVNILLSAGSVIVLGIMMTMILSWLAGTAFTEFVLSNSSYVKEQ